jgi:hypothetical protein
MIALRTGIESRRCRLFEIGEKPVWGSLGYQGTCRPYVPTARSRPAAVGSVFAMQEQERAMGKKAWSRKPLVAAPAVVLAALMLLPQEAGAYPFAGGIGLGPRHQLATDGVAGEGSIIDQADPTDDGSIIVECVGFLGRARPHLNGTENASMRHAASMPQYPLGPSKCWPGEHKRAP